MANISHRVFGTDIPFRVKKRLEALQDLAQQTKAPGEGISDETYIDPEGKTYKYEDLISFNDQFGGAAYLSSKTPFARMWTCVTTVKSNIKSGTGNYATERQAIDGGQISEKQLKEGKISIIRKGSIYKVVEHQNEGEGQRYYEIGNHILNQSHQGLNESVELQTEPGFEELTDNQFMRPQAGITSISSETEGMLGVIKKTTVNFTVHNFKDFDQVFSRFFLRPGAQLIVDFGWNTASLYKPETFINKSISGDLDKWLNGDTENTDEMGILEKSNGDLNVIFGHVTSFDSKVNSAGSFECSVEIVSKNFTLFDKDINKDIRNTIANSLDLIIYDYVLQKTSGGEFKVNKWDMSDEEREDYLAAQSHGWMEYTAYDLFSEEHKTEQKRKQAFEGLDDGRNIDDTEIEYGIAYQSKSKVRNVFMCFGLFEDRILNKRFGFADTVNDFENQNKNLQARFNSSNSFITYNKFLYQRQKYGSASTKFLYPGNWDKTYNTIEKRIPLDDQYDGLKLKSTKDKKGNERAGATGYDTGLDRPRIPLRELFISVDLIKEAIKNSSNVTQMIKMILDSINDDSQDVLNLQINANQYISHESSIVDINYTNEKNENQSEIDNLFEFKPFSPSTIVKDYQYAISTPTDGLQNMVAIQTLGAGQQMMPFDKTTDMNFGFRVINDSLSDNAMTSPDENSIVTGFKYLPDIGQGRMMQEIQDTRLRGIQSTTFFDKTVDLGITNVDQLKNAFLDDIAHGKVQYGLGQEIYETDKSLIDRGIWSSLNLTEDPRIFSIPKEYAAQHGMTVNGRVEISVAEGEVEKAELKFKQDPDDGDIFKGTNLPHTVVDSLKPYFEYKAKKTHYETNSSILPVSLTMSIYGIALLNPGDIFKVDYVPKRYRENVYFQITKVSHEVDSSWTTTLETVMRLSQKVKKLSLYESELDVHLSPSIFNTDGDVPLVNKGSGLQAGFDELLKCMGDVKIVEAMLDNTSFIKLVCLFKSKHNSKKIEWGQVESPTFNWKSQGEHNQIIGYGGGSQPNGYSEFWNHIGAPKGVKRSDNNTGASVSMKLKINQYYYLIVHKIDHTGIYVEKHTWAVVPTDQMSSITKFDFPFKIKDGKIGE